ncbi:replication initiation protein [Planomicrobium okeanokoites]|uniref:replication initiation protein n=1 Tax=Planomicrobium okeanokoites TaxID=244 RepID=UPI0009FBAACF|nr:replication initiation protein [Planomicrobium okeanokoites]
MDKKYLVTQSNNLIEARHKNPLTAREQKIVLTMASMIEPNDKDFKDYRISVKEFSKMLGLKGQAKYSDIKEISQNLLNKTIEIPRKDDGGFLLVNWISSAEYIEGSGVVELSFSPKLKPYMLQLKEHFTSYRLSNVLDLSSTHSIRLYELMKQWQHRSRWRCSVEDLKLQLGITKGTYERYSHFKPRVLVKAVDEVNEKTDISISFKEIKEGKRIEAIEFSIKSSIKSTVLSIAPENKENNSINEDIRARLNEAADGYQFDESYFHSLYEAAFVIWQEDTKTELMRLVEYVNEEKSIKNPLGFVKSKIKEAWEIFQKGSIISFADLKSIQKRGAGRIEMLPEWFTEPEDIKEIKGSPNSELIAEKEKLLANQAKKKQKLKGSN